MNNPKPDRFALVYVTGYDGATAKQAWSDEAKCRTALAGVQDAHFNVFLADVTALSFKGTAADKVAFLNDFELTFMVNLAEILRDANDQPTEAVMGTVVDYASAGVWGFMLHPEISSNAVPLTHRLGQLSQSIRKVVATPLLVGYQASAYQVVNQNLYKNFFVVTSYRSSDVNLSDERPMLLLQMLLCSSRNYCAYRMFWPNSKDKPQVLLGEGALALAYGAKGLIWGGDHPVDGYRPANAWLKAIGDLLFECRWPVVLSSDGTCQSEAQSMGTFPGITMVVPGGGVMTASYFSGGDLPANSRYLLLVYRGPDSHVQLTMDVKEDGKALTACKYLFDEGRFDDNTTVHTKTDRYSETRKCHEGSVELLKLQYTNTEAIAAVRERR